jgi:hypothetical protein
VNTLSNAIKLKVKFLSDPMVGLEDMACVHATVGPVNGNMMHMMGQ